MMNLGMLINIAKTNKNNPTIHFSIALAMAVLSVFIQPFFTNYPQAQAADFTSRCTSSGVLNCIGFDSQQEISAYVYGNESGNVLGVFDSTNKASGAGSLKFTIPTLTGSNSSGGYAFIFDEAGSGFMEGSTFYVQFRQRFSPEMLSSAMGGSGWKQAELTSYFGTYGDPMGVGLFNQAFSNKPALYVNGSVYPQTPGDGIMVSYVANQWMTFAFEIHVGTWGNFNSSIKVWAAVENQPLKQIYNVTNGGISQNPADAGSGFN